MRRQPFFSPCNHRKRARLGRFVYNDGSLGGIIWWCSNCGASAGGHEGTMLWWTYPKRARNPEISKPKRGRKRR